MPVSILTFQIKNLTLFFSAPTGFEPVTYELTIRRATTRLRYGIFMANERIELSSPAYSR